MSSWQPDQFVIDHLRVKSPRLDALAGEQRVSNLLKAMSLNGPARLTPSSILFIRTVRDPLPGSLQLGQGNIHAPPAWQQALTTMLDHLVANAARPSLEAVPANAEAVVFLDRSELLACLASDWCEGSVLTRWWWRSLLRQGAASQIVKELWRSAPEYVPAALEQLANKNEAVDFVRALTDDEARYILRNVAKSFALQPLVPVLDNFDTLAGTGRDLLDLHQLETNERLVTNQARTTLAGPWRPWVSECDAAGLLPEQQLFLGITLMLQRAPVKVRAASFQSQVRDWQQEIAPSRERQPALTDQEKRDALDAGEQLHRSSQPQFVSSSRAASQVSDETSSQPPASRQPILADSTAPPRAVREPNLAVQIDKSGPHEPRAKQAEGKVRQRDPNASRAADKFTRPPAVNAKAQLATTPETNRLAGNSRELSDGQHPSQSPETQLIQSEAASSAPNERLLFPGDDPQQLSAAIAESEKPEEWTETRLGGVFYLINLGLFLGLYRDFTTPDELGIQLNLWDFVALLGRELVGEDIESDPIWLMLRRLAKREEDDLLGSGFEPAGGFEFPVSSFELGEGPASEEKLEPGKGKRETAKPKPDTLPSLAAWIDRVMPYVRARLRQALGFSEQDDPGPMVCRHRARACLTPAHLDVFFSLADLPIEIRLAGLDRNPGWVPAAGRFITFHFE